jgi:diguanylate cyclase (GGDEF)-like protein/PAS domain S-box-containing protein
MSEQLLDPSAAAVPPRSPHDSVRGALLESRQRWQHLVSLAADLAFETDAEGRFTLIRPDSVFGWTASALIGQPATILIAPDGTGTQLNPFCLSREIRRHRTWLRRADGTLAMIAISATPLRNAAGQITGTRGIGIDTTDSDTHNAVMAGCLRREQVLHYILSRVNRETEPDTMMDTALWAMIHALGAEGAAVIGAVAHDARIEVLHECGPGASEILEPAALLVGAGPAYEAHHTTSAEGRFVLAVGCDTRTGLPTGLAIWRRAASRPWDREDTELAGAAVCIVRMVLEYDAMQREMTHQARTDPLTGLLNRRAFVDEMGRQLARLDRQDEGGTLMFVDLDSFKAVNDRLGHALGDIVLVRVANMLRRLVRPFDLITRFGGDEFAVWLSGADHMTAAERADDLCKNAPDELQALLPEEFPKLGVSVGIATRRPGSLETLEELTKRADLAMYEVKRSGRRHWRVSLLDGDS